MSAKKPDWSRGRSYSKTGKTKKPVKAREASLLFIAGLICLLIFGTIKARYAARLSFAGETDELKHSEQTSDIKAIKISKASIDLPVDETEIKGGVWEISESGASHLKTSANPGNQGNIVIYAHNSQERFGNLTQLDLGDKVAVITESGLVREYEVESTKIVDPDDVEEVLPTDEETLTLYTCTGILDNKRFVVKANPVNNISQKSTE